MSRTANPIGSDAVQAKGWWGAHRWLLLRRTSQFGILALFMVGPWFGWWLVKGNLSYSYTLDTLPLTDPLLLLQVLVTRHTPERNAVIGALLVLMFYAVVGGRVFCSWVCPVNVVTDAASSLRRRLDIRGGADLPRQTRLWMLALILVLAATLGTLVWELVNPVSMLHRGLIFGFGMGWTLIAAIFFFDLFVMKRGWCSHLCPVGAFYGLLGHKSLVRISAVRRQDCNDCLDCYAVCPEQHVLKLPLKGAPKGVGPLITSADCTNCARCIDVCAKDVFAVRMRHRGNETPHSAAP